jgi:hypothetical protein
MFYSRLSVLMPLDPCIYRKWTVVKPNDLGLDGTFALSYGHVICLLNCLISLLYTWYRE